LKTLVLHILLLFSFLKINGQERITVEEAQNIFNEVAENQSKKYMYYKVNMSSYKGYNSTIKEDESSGYFLKKGDDIVSYQMGVYSVQNKEIKVVVDSNELVIGVTFPDTSSDISYSNHNLIDKANYIKEITSVKKLGKHYLTINFIDGFTYNKITTAISSNNIVEYVEMYFSTEISYKDDEGKEQKEKAKIRIDYLPMKGKKSIPLEIENILTSRDGSYYLKPSFSNFELIDFRYEK